MRSRGVESTMNPRTQAPCQVQDCPSIRDFENKCEVLIAAWTRAGFKMVFCAWFLFGQGRGGRCHWHRARPVKCLTPVWSSATTWHSHFRRCQRISFQEILGVHCEPGSTLPEAVLCETAALIGHDQRDSASSSSWQQQGTRPLTCLML